MRAFYGYTVATSNINGMVLLYFHLCLGGTSSFPRLYYTCHYVCQYREGEDHRKYIWCLMFEYLPPFPCFLSERWNLWSWCSLEFRKGLFFQLSLHAWNYLYVSMIKLPKFYKGSLSCIPQRHHKYFLCCFLIFFLIYLNFFQIYFHKHLKVFGHVLHITMNWKLLVGQSLLFVSFLSHSSAENYRFLQESSATILKIIHLYSKKSLILLKSI